MEHKTSDQDIQVTQRERMPWLCLCQDCSLLQEIVSTISRIPLTNWISVGRIYSYINMLIICQVSLYWSRPSKKIRTHTLREDFVEKFGLGGQRQEAQVVIN